MINLLEQARQKEKAGDWVSAAAVYKGLFNKEPASLEVTGRLLAAYRKLKDYKKELAVIEAAIRTRKQLERSIQEKWIKEHPKAAKAGRMILRNLKRSGLTEEGFVADILIARLEKRKLFVYKRLGRDVPATMEKRKVPKDALKAPSGGKVIRMPVAESRLPEKNDPPKLVIRSLTLQKQRSLPVVDEKKLPSVFLISLTYRVSLETIDKAMPKHMAYLNKQYAAGKFLLSGRKVPRTGGIILALGKDRKAVEKLVGQDPFIKMRLADVEIIEFSASQTAKELAFLKKKG